MKKTKLNYLENYWYSLKVVVAFILIVLISTISIEISANGAVIGTDFSSQCPLLLSQADNFARVCPARARQFERQFNDQPEVHSVYFDAPSAGSHFALGCTLDAQRHISFLGIYYTIDPSNFLRANSDEIAFVDFDGNAGFIQSGQFINFVAIRAFETRNLSLPSYVVGSKNCVKSGRADDQIQDQDGVLFNVTEQYINGALVIHACDGPRNCVEDQKFVEIIKNSNGSDSTMVYISPYYGYYIEDGGGLLVGEKEIETYCPLYYASELAGKALPTGDLNVIREVCFKRNFH